MSNSQYVCGRSGCGAPLSSHRNGWRHALGGKTGAIPKSRAHKPVPVPRADYDRLADLSTPVEEARAIAARFKALDREVNGDA